MTGDDCSYIPLMNHGSSDVHQLRERSWPLPSLLFIRYFFHSSWNISETLVDSRPCCTLSDRNLQLSPRATRKEHPHG